LRKGADNEQRWADKVEHATAKAVGQGAADKAAKEDADQRRRGNQPFPEGAETKGRETFIMAIPMMLST
jgi:hypothetical protein